METEVPVDQLESHPKFSWLVRPCERYKEEYSDCTSIKAKFHQYFINGETADCSQWKTDYNRCLDFRNKRDLKALEDVITSERLRRIKRLEGHHQNNVWEPRESPPDDWSKPIRKEYAADEEFSYIAVKCKELKEGKPSESVSTCSIS
ncbi:synaptic plasticity regulator PANTS [Macrobrachium rosenbergii]|uniref:synaptic plasticity regulator PANTS n=1 Tax=Macrobrachium rosenbergii TaxID=79674 RepID=UPI0034D398DC